MGRRHDNWLPDFIMRTISLGGRTYRREVKWGPDGGYHGEWAVVADRQNAPWELYMRFNCRVKQPLTQSVWEATLEQEGWPLYRTSMQRMRSCLANGQERYWWRGWDQKDRLCILVFQQASAWFKSGATCWSVSCPDIVDFIGDRAIDGNVGIYI